MNDRPLVPPGADAVQVDVAAGSLRVLRARAPFDAPTPADRRGRLPLVLVHGGGSDNAAISWFHVFERFGAQRDVVAPDLPGFGGSLEVPAVGGADNMADVVAEVARSLRIERAIVAGVSMGGDVALHVALRHPELVAGLALVAPGGLVGVLRNPPTQFAAWLAARLPDPVLERLARLANRHVDAALRGMVHDPSSLPDRLVDEFAREALRPGAGMAYGRYNQWSLGPRRMRNDLRGVVDRIDAPTLIVHGADDRLVPFAGSRTAAARMRDARLVRVERCGHWVQLEHAEIFATELAAFASRVDGDQAERDGVAGPLA